MKWVLVDVQETPFDDVGGLVLREDTEHMLKENISRIYTQQLQHVTRKSQRIPTDSIYKSLRNLVDHNPESERLPLFR